MISPDTRRFAIETLTRLRDRALARRDKHERRLGDPWLPRGDLPVMEAMGAAETEAMHLKLAIDALGGEVGDAPHEARQREVRRASMPELTEAVG